MASNPQWSDLWSLDRDRTVAAANGLLPAWVSLVLVLLIGWQLARIVWMFVPGTSAGDTVIVPAGQMRPAQSESEVTDSRSSAAAISSASIFGVVDPEIEVENVAAAPESVEDLEESRTNLKLKGTMASQRPEFSIAIISDGNNEEKVYAVGDPILAGASLHAVYSDRVVLNENGELTSLKLPRDYESPAPGRRRTAPTRRQATQTTSIQSVVAQNVSRLADVIRPTPYFVNGQQRGYRVYPGRDRRQFAALGLRPGDLIREIDGQSLTDPAQAMQIFQSLGTAQQVSVTVERNGQPETIVLKTDQLNVGNGRAE